MKGPIEAARTRDFPYIVSRDERRLSRTNVIVANAPIAGVSDASSFVVYAAGALDPNDRLTPTGRRLILDKSVAHARRSRSERCIVWALDDCTWIQSDGSHFDGPSPPDAEATSNPYLYAEMPLVAEHCWTIALPAGARHPHVCIVPIDRRRIEVVGGEPMFLGTFEERVPDHERDPARSYVAEDGTFLPPRRFRGQPVTATEGWALYGPVQPVGSGTVLLDPFPQQVVEACERVAGMRLDPALTRRAWNMTRPALGYQRVGVLMAA